MNHEQAFIAEINANAGRDPRTIEYAYSDWLDEQGDPRAEAWRVLLEAGKRPEFYDDIWWWWSDMYTGNLKYDQANVLPFPTLDDQLRWGQYHTYFDAMNGIVIGWVRANRDEDFLRETETVR